ncbi:ABC transporter substrate-binding protein [Natroniella sulfidigena]|uniref:ABC transporter substrate-binding protein n=1 Tax=Natroniella sulfidigena TaxID=723921 RepID=UPI00200ACC9F|nr:ABC transporter substrate-binding protein [Natroniella sulfidigena]MCK8815802.1 ABC transporter substrate-binding protein [Natroniella sulfidigena]
MFKKSVGIGLLLVLLAALVVGCGGVEEATEEAAEVTEEDRYGGTYYARLGSDAPTLDPAHSTDSTSSRVIENIFDRLVEFDGDAEVVPGLAEDWEISEDGLTWTFYLREGVKFHNGSEVTADDVVFTFTRILDPAVQSDRANYYDRVEGASEFRDGEIDEVPGLVAVDDYTVQFQLEESYTPLLSILAVDSASIVPQDAVEKYGNDDFANNPVGSGPFEFVEWQSDHQIVLERNDDYYVDGLPYLDEVVFRVISESSSAFAEYEQGNIYEQIDGDLPDGQMDRILNSGEFDEELVVEPRLGTYYFGFNVQEEPFDNLKVRKALNYAVDRDTIVNVIRAGIEEPATGILPPGMDGYDPELEGYYEQDTEKAQELLAEAGYPDGLPGTYELAYNTDDANQSVAEALQANLRTIDVDVELVNVEWGTYLEKIDEGDTEMFRLGWVSTYPDPDNFLYNNFHSSNIGATNGSWYDDPETDEMLEKGRGMAPGSERAELYSEINETLIKDAPWMPIYYYSNTVLTKPFVNDFEVTARGEEPLTDVWLHPNYQ